MINDELSLSSADALKMILKGSKQDLGLKGILKLKTNF